MSDILRLKGGSIVTPFDHDDLLEIIEDKLGDDMRRAIEGEFEDGAAMLEEIQGIAKDYTKGKNAVAFARELAHEILDVFDIKT